MPMHPALQPQPLAPVLDLLFTPDPEPALQALVNAGLLQPEQLPAWRAARRPVGRAADNGDLATQAKLLVDAQAGQRGKLAPSEPLAVLGQLLPLLQAAQSQGLALDAAARAGQRVLDLGAGLFYPLSTAALLHANGLGEAWAYEPFAVQPEFAEAALLELQRAVAREPERFRCFPDSPPAPELKARLARLDLHRLAERIEELNQGRCERVDLGGVTLFQRPAALPDQQLDWVFSNSVLEHIDDLAGSLAWQRRLLKPGGWAFHTVDFVDHRHYFDRSLHPLQCLFDGVLDAINGLRPSQMEALFMGAGFTCFKRQKLQLPAGLLDTAPPFVPRFEALRGRPELYEWVNGYLLRSPG